jgi:hypothetical protein
LITVIDSVKVMVRMAAGDRWHTQRDVDDPNSEAEEGAGLFGTNDNPDDDVSADEFLKPIAPERSLKFWLLPRRNEALEKGYLEGRYGGIPVLKKSNLLGNAEE